MPEVSLEIGRCQMIFGNVSQEQLARFEQRGARYVSEAETERREKERIAQHLRSLGINPERLSE